jgi:dTDP-glucose 4,6-dehydratase/UDP-glucuronate decarboxylase
MSTALETKYGFAGNWTAFETHEWLRRLDNQSVLILGGSGVIGQAVEAVLALAAAAFNIRLEVTSVGRNWGVSEIPPGTKMRRIPGDLLDHRFLNSLKKHDFVIHAATYGQPAIFEKNTESTIKLNTQVTLDVSKLANVGFLFISSSEIYSGTEGAAQEELLPKLPISHPRSAYVYSKLLGEVACQSIDKSVSATVARVALAYGPGFGGGDRRVLYELVRKGLNSDSIVLLDDGSASRTYGYVTDIARDLVSLMISGGGTYNVGGSSRVTIAQLAEEVGRQLNVPVLLGPGQNLAAPQEVSMNLTKLHEVVGHRSLVPLSEGIATVINWSRLIGKSRIN